jgi:5,5'-dehydrodivanillate O-demethylase
MLRQDQIRVPIDDTHTLYWWYNVHEREDGEPEQAKTEIPMYEVPLPGVGRDGLPIWDVMDNNSGQDNFAWQSQGPVTPRWTEHLGESDRGIILYRRLLREQMKIVEQGGDPMNTFRDPATNVSVAVPDDGRGKGRRKGEISTGQAVKYSPIAQERARKAGLATPEKVVRELAGFGQIHPRD